MIASVTRAGIARPVTPLPNGSSQMPLSDSRCGASAARGPFLVVRVGRVQLGNALEEAGIRVADQQQ